MKRWLIIISFIVLIIPIIVSIAIFGHWIIGPIIYGSGWIIGYVLIIYYTQGFV